MHSYKMELHRFTLRFSEDDDNITDQCLLKSFRYEETDVLNELYIKSEKENEDRKRIKEYLTSPHSYKKQGGCTFSRFGA